MSFNRDQFKDLIERTLEGMGPEFNSPAAVNLLLGTAAQESFFGRYLRQVRGPALGVFQMEPATFEWLKEKYADRFPWIAKHFAFHLEWDLRLAIVFARLRYWVVPQPLPDADDLDGLAAYWKANFNSILGAGNVEQFKRNYGGFVV